MGHAIYPAGGRWPIKQSGSGITRAENETLNVSTVGDYDTLIDKKLKPGDFFSVADASIGVPSGGWAIRTVSIVKEEQYGNGTQHVGIVNLTLVHITSQYAPFETTVDVDMREVTKSLITHPDIQGDGIALKQIRLWNETPEARRVSYSGTTMRFWYYDPQSATPETPVEVTNPNAIKYLFALAHGIESYNVYLPVVQRMTRFVRISGDSGSSVSLTYDDDLGHFISSSSVPECPSGYTKGLWFKNTDRYSRAADGVWTRTEEWTFTNDTTHDWIYKELD